MDLQLAQLSDGCINFLGHHMPSIDGQVNEYAENGQVERRLDYEKWLDEAFQE
jgi:hypothetical protein